MVDLTQIDVVLFDMDGTLIDSERLGDFAFRACEGLLRDPISDRDREIFDHVWRIEGTLRAFHEYVREQIVPRLREAVSERAFLRTFYKHYQESLSQVVPMPSARALLETLQPCFGLGLVTGSNRAQTDRILDVLGWGEMFDVVVTDDDVMWGKPDPEPYQRAIRELCSEARRTLVVENSTVGVASGRAAGARVIGVHAGNPRSQDLSKAHLESESLQTMLELLLPSIPQPMPLRGIAS